MSLTFDFNKVALGIIKDFPQLQATSIFVDTSRSNPNPLVITMDDAMPLIAASERQLNAMVGLSMGDQRSHASILNSGLRTVVVDEDSGLSKRLNHIDQNIARTFVIDHEAGHMLVENASNIGIEQIYGHGRYAENAADSFGVIRNIQRFGDTDEARALREQLSFTRAWQCLISGDTDYMTVSVLEKINEDSKKIDFSSMTADQTTHVASLYANGMMPGNEDAAAFNRDFANYVVTADFSQNADPYLASLASTTLSTQYIHTFQIGAIAFRPFLSASGVDVNGQNVKIEPAIASKFLSAFEDRARQFQLDALADSFAALKKELLDNAEKPGIGAKNTAKPMVLKI